SEPVNSILTTAQIYLIYALIDENITENINEPVKQSLFKIISFILNNNSANGNMLAFVLGKGRSSLTRHLKLLCNTNIIEFIGSDKTGGYYLTKQTKERLHICKPTG
ncbi:MAG: hypothetical protein LBB64_03120, partial [Dysgonamonadaceae bacterium]|nr:hypothetical protein [Dysgonamonadaceae bacterium]